LIPARGEILYGPDALLLYTPKKCSDDTARVKKIRMPCHIFWVGREKGQEDQRTSSSLDIFLRREDEDTTVGNRIKRNEKCYWKRRRVKHHKFIIKRKREGVD